MSSGKLDREFVLKVLIVSLLAVSLISGLYYVIVLEPQGQCVNDDWVIWGDPGSEFCYNVVQIAIYSAIGAALIAIWMVPGPPKKQKEARDSP